MTPQDPSLVMHQLFDKIVARSSQIRLLHSPRQADFIRHFTLMQNARNGDLNRIFIVLGHEAAMGILDYLEFPLTTDLRPGFDELQSVVDRANGYIGTLLGVTALSDVDLLRSTKPQQLDTLRRRAVYIVDARGDLSEVNNAVHFICEV